MMEHGSPLSPLLPVAEQKGGHAMERRRAIQATIWSFIATAAFAFGFVLPYRGRKDTLDFVTGFLVEKSLSVDNLFVFLMIFEYFKGALAFKPMQTFCRGSPCAGPQPLSLVRDAVALSCACPSQSPSTAPSASCDGASSRLSCCAAS